MFEPGSSGDILIHTPSAAPNSSDKHTSSPIPAVDDRYALWLHELRTPLTSLIAYADLFLNGNLGPLSQDQRRVMETVLELAHEFQHRVDTVLEYFRIQAGFLELDCYPTDVLTLLEDVARESRVRHSVRVHVSASPEADDAFEAHIDAFRMWQVLHSLLDFILWQTPGPASVLVSLWRRGNVLGITLERHPQPELSSREQVRVENIAPSNRAVLAGLSMLSVFVARRIIAAHGGRLSIQMKGTEAQRVVILLPTS